MKIGFMRHSCVYLPTCEGNSTSASEQVVSAHDAQSGSSLRLLIPAPLPEARMLLKL